jgi:hypothetical protein
MGAFSDGSWTGFCTAAQQPQQGRRPDSTRRRPSPTPRHGRSVAPHTGRPGCEVSDLGRVRSIDRVVKNNADKRRHGTSSLGARRTHCKRGHPFDEANTLRVQGRRRCKRCERDRQRKYRGIPPSRFREPIEPRLREGLRLMAKGMSTTHAAQLAKIDRGTLGRAWRSAQRTA